jgi:hypothetical protein
MPWPRFPTRADRIQAEIDAAAHAGPSGLARLAALCLWDSSARLGHPPPSVGTYGPDEIAFLNRILGEKYEQFLAGDAAPPSSDIPFPFLYPRPEKPRQRVRDMSTEEGARQVEMAKHELGRAMEMLDYLVPLQVPVLWKRGLTLAELEPLIRTLQGQVDSRTIEMNFQIGEIETALRMAREMSGSEVERVAVARAAIGAGCIAEGRRMLDAVRDAGKLAEIDLKYLAAGYGYAGDAHMARQIGGKRTKVSPFEAFLIEGAVAAGQYYASGLTDSAAVLPLLDPILREYEGDPFGGVMQLNQFLGLHLTIRDYEAGWKILEMIEAKIHEIRLKPGLEYRISDACAILSEHVEAGRDRIYAFARDILTTAAGDTIRDQQRWRMVYAVNGVAWLIFQLTPSDEIDALLAFAREWHHDIQKGLKHNA